MLPRINNNTHVFEFGPPGSSKSTLIDHIFRRHWWQFWKPRMPMVRPRFTLIASLHPEDLVGYLTHDEVQAIARHATTPSTPAASNIEG
jgi:hypothetical protein